MEAPDKIYLAFDKGFVAQASNIKEDVNGNSVFLPKYIPITYICKESLLEWAKEKQAFYRKRADDIKDDDSGMAYFCGKEYAFEMLVDKLESL